MLRALCLILSLVVLPLGSAAAAGPPERGGNAALLYWQAFATLPRLTDAEQSKLTAECLTMPLDAHAREVVARADYALRMMRLGAARTRCEWDTAYEEGIYARLPHAEAAGVLSALACLRARLRFEHGQSAEAIDDLVAALTMGRHVSQGGVLIVTVFGYSIEQRVGKALALSLPGLDPGALKTLKARLAALPPGGRPSAAMRYEEKSCLDWFVRVVKGAKDEESLLALLSPLFHDEELGKGGDELAKARTFLKDCGGTAAGVLRYAEEARPSYALLAKTLDLPLDQFAREFEREQTKRAGNPVFKVFFPAVAKVRQAQVRAEVRRALLAAAVAVRLDGRDALKQHPDPATNEMFGYVPFAGGFELRSKLTGPDGKPVTLAVGRRGK
jgi:hypothetical protein